MAEAVPSNIGVQKLYELLQIETQRAELAEANVGVITTGAGDPSATAGTAGHFYFRSGTPSTSNQRIYVCTVTGTATHATWVGIV